MEIIVTTCDKYQWVLPIFFHLFKKFWPDCPWPVTVVGGQALEENLDSYSVYRGDDRIWCDLLLKYLEPKSDDDFVVIFCEDYTIMDTVDTKEVMRCLKIIQADPTVQLMRLNAVPGPTLPWIDELNIGMFDKENAPYLSSLVPCIWRVGHLRRLIEPGWSAWDVELVGTPKARKLPGVYLGSTKVLIPCHNFLIRGEVNPAAAKEVQEKW